MKHSISIIQKGISCIIAFLIMLSAGCSMEEPNNSSEASSPDDIPVGNHADASAWFCPYQASPQMDSPAKILNIATGEVLVACPDPLCNHSASSETCFYNYSYDRTHVRGAAYADGHIVFAAERTSDDGLSMKLYDYDIRESSMAEVYTFDFIASTFNLYSNGTVVFFTSIDSDDVLNSAITLYSYDPSEKAVTFIDDNAKYALSGTDVCFFEDYYVFIAGYNDEDSIIYCKRSYDGSSEELIEALPDGTPFEIFGWSLKPDGVFANTWGLGGVYFPDDGRKVMFPVDSATTKPEVYKDSVYFTTRSSDFTELGYNPVSHKQMRGYAYNNEVYVVNKNGTYKHYSVESEYHFIIEAVYENIIIGRIAYRITENGNYIRDNDYDFIRLDLSTGETTLYDMTRRSGFARKTFITNVTLNDN